MPGGRPSVPLDEHKSFIVDCISLVGLTQQEVCDELEQSHDIKVGRSTLVKTLARWGVRTRRPNFSDTPALRMRLNHFFHHTRQTDAEISATLTKDEGMDITPVRVAKLRKKMGLYKRVDADKKDVTEQSIEEVLKAEFEENEDVRKLGQKALYKYLRKKHGITGRDRIFTIAKRLDPEGPERRLRAQRKEARRNGLEKERRAKEMQEQEQADATDQQQQQQHPLPSQYLPLDPAIYHGDYPQQHQHPVNTAQNMPDPYYDSSQAAYSSYANDRHVTAAPDMHQYPQYAHQGDQNYHHNPY